MKLSHIEAKDENKKTVVKLQFLKGDYFEREYKTFIFEPSDANFFYDQLSEALDKYGSTFFYDYSDEEDEGEEEEDVEDKIGDIDDSDNNPDMSNKYMNKINFGGNSGDLISSSRKNII